MNRLARVPGQGPARPPQIRSRHDNRTAILAHLARSDRHPGNYAAAAEDIGQRFESPHGHELLANVTERASWPDGNAPIGLDLARPQLP